MATEEQMKKHVEKWRGSGLTMAEYASRRGLSYHKMGYWVRKLVEKKEGKSKFLPVGKRDEMVEIELPNQIKIRVPEGSLKKIISELLRVA